ncbi:hypothetical protein ABMY26_04310 [Azospirillum sp. HJ39]|uniref:hypothetical protein n=1 Tax=Azospirillum sp. HJ39 TaxID=3159496 RepID=UPI0035563C4B
MSGNLASFIFNSLVSLLNDPDNQQYYLPTVLGGIENDGSPLFPLSVATLPLGTITGQSGLSAATAIAGSWYQVVSAKQPWAMDHYGIPTPCTAGSPCACNGTGQGTGPSGQGSSDCPQVSLSQAVIDNLQYLSVDSPPTITPTSTGYTVTFGLSQLITGPSTPTNPITLTSNFLVQQSVCTAAAKKGGKGDGDQTQPSCDGFLSDTVDMNGSITVQLPTSSLTVTVTLAPASDGSQLDATITGLVFASTGSLTVESLNPDSSAAQILQQAWTDLADEALQNAATMQSIVDCINDWLQSNLNSFQSQVEGLVNGALDKIVGEVPQTGLVSDPLSSDTNPADGYLLERLHTALVTEGEAYYLPKDILFFSSPVLEPYTIQSISLPSQTVGQVPINDISLTSVTISGTSNATIQPGAMSLNGNTITATVSFGILDPGPTVTGMVGGQTETLTVPSPPITIGGSFAFTPGQSPNPVTGNITVTVQQALATLVFTFSGTDYSDLQVDISALTLALPTSQDATSYVSFSVDLTDDSGMDSLIDSALNTDTVIGDLLSQLQSTISSDLPAIGTSISSSLQSLIAQQLNS